MHRKFMPWIILVLSISALGESEVEELNLDESIDAYDHYWGHIERPKLTGYGSGGYGDPAMANFNLNVCQSGQSDGQNCSSFAPDNVVSTQWRFVRNLGWRKFTAYGAARKDWWDFKRTLGWPFTRLRTFGYGWW